ncbi:IS66 family insertion sequence element accessory protein TnpA [Desulfofustis limnaeus]|nr:hypothetical protein [Desulfofustis limnaeus]MDX9897103.1 hypothetical protein [Desulfofustis sp.]
MEQEAIKNRRTKQSFWQHHIDDWRQSGKSQRRYCLAHGLALATFGYWRRKIREGRTEKPHFYPLVLSGQSFRSKTTHMSHSGLRVVLGNNRFTIEIDDHFSPAVLRDLVTTLEQL